jgi:hypothetical protein
LALSNHRKRIPEKPADGHRQRFGRPPISPLALNLHYLVTPFANFGAGDSASRDEDHMVLGKVLQIFYDNAIIVLRDTLNNIAEELRIVFVRLTLEELTRIWEALREPYRLSICYRVQVTRIDSNRVIDRARVVDRALASREGTDGG